MTTIYDEERPGLTRQQWKRRKKTLRKMGLKRGQWYKLAWDYLSIWSIEVGMFIKNKRYGNIYYVVRIEGQEIVVLARKDIGKKDWYKRTKTLKKLNLYQWTRG